MSGNNINLNGRELFTVKINNLGASCIYLKNIENPSLTNYVFKYMNTKDESQFTSFEQKDDEIKLTKKEIVIGKNQYSSFSREEHYDVSYFIKGFYLIGKIKDEKRDTIAISESQGYYIQ